MVTLNRQQNWDTVSRMISWGHWFTLFNILLALAIGSRYLIASDWPGSLEGRIYAWASWLGHFSFLVFCGYLLILFPLTFVIASPRLLRVIAALFATAGLTLLALDTEVYTRFHLHLNRLIWQVIVTPSHGELTRSGQLILFAIPVLFLVEMGIGAWCWRKIRSLRRHRRLARPVVALFILAFMVTHLMYIWADANFNRSITMQRANLPASHPMTARRFLEKYGLIDPEEYQRRMAETGNPEALSVQYPLNPVTFHDSGAGYNLLLVTVDKLNAATLPQFMPNLVRFGRQNIIFSQHMSSGNRYSAGTFGLFYGISPSYMEGIQAAHTPSVLLSALTRQQYQLALFTSNAFGGYFERQVLLSDLTLKQTKPQPNALTVTQWQRWLLTRPAENAAGRWFSWISLTNAAGLDDPAQPRFISQYRQQTQQTDAQIGRILDTLQQQNLLDNTVVIITAQQGLAVHQRDSGNPWNRPHLQVPLIVHWPGVPVQIITKLTSHQDIMMTLMKRLLHAADNPADYSQGEDLFVPQRKNNWVISADRSVLAVTTPVKTLVLDKTGDSRVYRLNGEPVAHPKSQLPLLLQVLTEEKRFIAN